MRETMTKQKIERAIENGDSVMKFYYFNQPVILLEEVKEFSITKIKIINGQILYVNSELITNEIKLMNNLIITI